MSLFWSHFEIHFQWHMVLVVDGLRYKPGCILTFLTLIGNSDFLVIALPTTSPTAFQLSKFCCNCILSLKKKRNLCAYHLKEIILLMFQRGLRQSRTSVCVESIIYNENSLLKITNNACLLQKNQKNKRRNYNQSNNALTPGKPL